MTNNHEKSQFNKNSKETKKMEIGKHERPTIAQEIWFHEDEKEFIKTPYLNDRKSRRQNGRNH